ncbi:hypothetical protein ACWN8B_06185 [Vagococcus zengguangii]|uniref:Uncharacterized protein n=1 Tax=Vagococcus zengguangii TaxID=2571750 RepID=A0A4D7CT71_9ENTE|nr:hypothetical protein [Vagococcus zengguangii]QCI86002.1 hypothetical protein FA707_03055 [Vagococcus zengguangii]
MRKSLEQVYLMIQFNKLESIDVIESHIKDWFWMGKIISAGEPLTYQELVDDHTINYSETAFLHKIVSWSEEAETHLIAKNTHLSCECYVENGYLAQTILMPFERFHDVKRIVEDYLDQKMQEQGLYAYIRDYQEYLSHNLFYLDERKQYLVHDLPNLRQMKNDQSEIVIDCSQLSGYDLMFEKLCLTSCWKMWFSSNYYHLIPKQAFLDVQQVDRIDVLDNEVVRIMLFDSPNNWQLPANLSFQRLFRKQLGFDQIEWINGVGVLEDPYAEFIKAQHMIQMIQYQNENMQPVAKTQATHFISRLFNYSEHVYLEARRSGQLNYQAYFPFETIDTKESLAYWLLNTEYCLDNGVEALTYYIDYYLRALRKLSKQDNRPTLLRFYLPEKAFNQLSEDQLINALLDKQYLVYPAIDKNHYLVVKYGQTISVRFDQANYLRSDAKNWRQPEEKLDDETKERFEDKIKDYFMRNRIKKED